MKSAEVTKQNCETSNKETNKNKLQKIKLKMPCVIAFFMALFFNMFF